MGNKILIFSVVLAVTGIVAWYVTLFPHKHYSSHYVLQDEGKVEIPDYYKKVLGYDSLQVIFYIAKGKWVIDFCDPNGYPNNIYLPSDTITLPPAPDEGLTYYPYIKYKNKRHPYFVGSGGGNEDVRKPIWICQKVQSITFKYDSIMIINFDSSEIK